MHIFITGGTGYVGTPIIEELLGAGHRVHFLVRSPDKAWFLERLGAIPVHGNLREPNTYLAVASQSDAIVHLASEPGPDRAVVGRLAIEGLLRAARLGRVAHLVYTSVLFVLGTVDGGTEESMVRGDGYAQHRAEEEALVRLADGDGLTTAVIRPGMVYGGGNGGSVSELLRSAHEEGRASFVGDGNNRWSLVHRSDVASLYRAVLERKAAGIFHAVDGAPLSVRDVASRVAEAAGIPGRMTEVPVEQVRPVLGGFADALCLDQAITAPASLAIGWRPKQPAFDAYRANREWLDSRDKSR